MEIENSRKLDVSEENDTISLDKFTFLCSFTSDRVIGGRNLATEAEDRREFLKTQLPIHGVTCVIIFKGSRKTKKRQFELSYVEYAKCAHTNCRKFKFVMSVTKTNILFEVNFKGPEVTIHVEEHSYQLRGKARQEVKEKLLTTLPNVVRSQDISSLDAELFKDGNWQNLRSLDVYQKARSETKAEMDEDKDPLTDLIIRSLRQPLEERYIQFPYGGLLVYLYSREQVKILIRRGQKVTLYFDATGTVVRSPRYETTGSRILYYAAVVNINGKIVPIAELISSRHDSATIGSFLLNFKHFVVTKCNKKWPIFDAVVVDWSFALITSVCLSFNEMTLFSYLRVIYKYLSHSSGGAVISSVIPVKSCCAHFIKMVCRKIKDFISKSGTRKLIIDVIAVLIQCSSLDELSVVFENLIILLVSPTYDNRVKNVIDMLASYPKSDLLQNIENVSDEYDSDAEETVHGQYTTSPFFLHFYKIFERSNAKIEEGEISENSDNINTKNPYMSKEFAIYILHRWMAFAPLWTCIFDKNKRYSNSVVEGWFNILKTEVLMGQTNLKVSRFMEAVEKKIKIELKSVDLAIGLAPKKVKKHILKKAEHVVDDPLQQETWKRRKITKGYFLKKNLRVMATDTDVKDTVEIKDEEEVIPSIKFGDKSGSRTELRKLENGLFLDPNYYLYVALQNVPFKVAVFDHPDNALKIALNSSDYLTLRSVCNELGSNNEDFSHFSLWLTDHVIDSCAISLLKNKCNIYYIDTISSSILLADTCETRNLSNFSPYVKNLENINYIVIPHKIYGNHWVLIILDLNSKIIYVVNPSNSAATDIQAIEKAVKQFMIRRDRLQSQRKLNARSWTVKDLVNIPKQQDSYNCGVFVIYYVKLFSDQNCLEGWQDKPFFDADAFRLDLQRYLLLTSADMSELCVICGQGDVGSNWILCTCCQRWSHFRCLNVCPETEKEMSTDTYDYKCKLCQLKLPWQDHKILTNIKLQDFEVGAFIKLHILHLQSIWQNKNSPTAKRFLGLKPDSRERELKWDYLTDFFPYGTSYLIYKTLEKELTECTDAQFRCFVLLPEICDIIFNEINGINLKETNIAEEHHKLFYSL